MSLDLKGLKSNIVFTCFVVYFRWALCSRGNHSFLNALCHVGMAWLTHLMRVRIIRISLSKAFAWRFLAPSLACTIILEQLSLFFLISTVYDELSSQEDIWKHKDNEVFSQSKGKHKALCEQYPSRLFFDAPSILKGIQEHFHTRRSTAVK